MKIIGFRVEDDLKVLADAIMEACGENLQSVMHNAYKHYIFDHVGVVSDADLLHAVHAYVIAQQKSSIAPLLERVEEHEKIKALSEAKQAELMTSYEEILATKQGRNLLDILARRLQRDEPRNAFADVFFDNELIFRETFTVDENDDENKIIDTAMSMARIHTTQQKTGES